MEKEFSPLRGFREILPEEYMIERAVEDRAREVFSLFGYCEVGIPTVEPVGLFEVKSGEEIRHRMFRFMDLGGREVCLRAEGTPPIARLLATKMRDKPLPLRLAYLGNMFRYDEPQKGRHREFSQAGFELIGPSTPYADAEIIDAANTLMMKLGFKNHYIRLGQEGILRGLLNKVGATEQDQNAILSRIDTGKIQEALQLYDGLDKEREYRATFETILGSPTQDNESKLRRARDLLAGLEESLLALSNLEQIIAILTRSGIKNVNVDIGFARGLEYYTGMIFEVYVPNEKFALGGGGRYDKLLSLFGWDVPAVGCAMGLDRIALAIGELDLIKDMRASTLFLISAIEDSYMDYANQVTNKLREAGASAILEMTARPPGNVFSRARKMGVRFVGLVGAKEKESNTVSIKDLARGIEFALDPESVTEVTRHMHNAI